MPPPPPPLSGDAALDALLSVPPYPPPTPLIGRRPLVNAGNTCFLGATLQALLALPPAASLAAAAAAAGPDFLRRAGAPTLAALGELGQALALDGSTAPGGLLPGRPLSVDALLPTLARLGGRAARPTQEDAQEYLVQLLDALHCELGALAAARRGGAGGAGDAAHPPPPPSDDDGGWVTAGRSRRDAAVTRGSPAVAGGATRVSAAFGGALRSEVRAPRAPPSATLQPFTVLSLGVGGAGVVDVESALDAFAAAEAVEGYRPRGAAAPARAAKTVTLADPPPAHVLPLCRGAYGAGTAGTLHARVAAPARLRLKASWLARGGGGGAPGAPPPPRRRHRDYALAAAVFHHGRSAAAGHYTAAVEAAEGGRGAWLEFDDAAVRAVRGGDVAADGGAYLLFYRAVD